MENNIRVINLNQNKMFKIIPIDVFSTDVVVSINQTDDQLYKHLSHKFTRKQFNLAWGDWKSDARTVTHNDGFVIVRFRNKIKKDADTLGLVAHEAYHATYSVLNRIGIQPGFETEEVYAYLIQFLVRKIIKI
jgi:hypothetical protein